MIKKYDNELNEILEANIEVHTKMIDDYDSEPHFREENQRKVKDRLLELQQRNGSKKLLDIGCGTGFIINLAKDIFEEIHGVDITLAMLEKIDTTGHNISLHNSVAEALPFEDGVFDIVTSYAFIHHVAEYKDVLKEAYRVLRDEGMMYIDLEPNKAFWKAMTDLDKEKQYSGILSKEIDSVLHTDDRVSEEYGIDQDVFNKAEYTKSILGGIDPDELTEIAQTIGFSKVEVYYEWFLGEGHISHTQSFEAAHTIDSYLKESLPLTRHLYKYLRFVLVK